MRRITAHFKIFFILLAITPSAYFSVTSLQCKLLGDDVCSIQINIMERETPIKLNSVDSDETSYKVLLFNDATVNYIPTKISVNFKELTALKVMNSSLLEIERSNFEGLEKLTELNFENNLITSLKADVFEFLENLRKINLDKNQISSIPSKIFTKNLKLMEISLIKNKIGTINDQTFRNLNSLKILHISYNQLRDLRSGTFDDCIELTRIYINNNNLTYIPANIFKNNKKLRFSIGNFKKNKCIDEYSSGNDLNSLTDLNNAFIESCKPPNQDQIDELTNTVKELTETKQKLENSLNIMKSKLNQTVISYENCKTTLSVKDSEIDEVNMEKKNTEKELANFKEKSMTKEEELNEKIEKLENQVKEMEEAKMNLSLSADEFTTKIQNQTTEIKKLEEEAYNFKESWITCRKQRNLTSENFNNEVQKSTYLDNLNRDLLAQIDKLKTDLIAKDKVISDNADFVAKAKLELIQKEYFINMLYDNIRKANETIGNLTALNCDADAISSITNPIATNFYNIECIFDESKFVIGGSVDSTFYTCNINNLKVLSCKTGLNGISNSPNGKIVNSLAFDDSYVVNFPKEVAEKFRNLKSLKITNSGFGNFVANFCELSSDFEIVQITKSYIGDSIVVGNCISLKLLKIEYSNIKEIHAQKPIKSLINLILRNNQIQKISKEFFSKFESLKNIQLSGNQITHIDGDTFDANKDLAILNLSYNPIKTIDSRIFEKNSKLFIVDFSNSSCIDKTYSGFENIGIMKVTLVANCTPY